MPKKKKEKKQKLSREEVIKRINNNDFQLHLNKVLGTTSYEDTEVMSCPECDAEMIFILNKNTGKGGFFCSQCGNENGLFIDLNDYIEPICEECKKKQEDKEGPNFAIDLDKNL